MKAALASALIVISVAGAALTTSFVMQQAADRRERMAARKHAFDMALIEERKYKQECEFTLLHDASTCEALSNPVRWMHFYADNIAKVPK